MQAAGPNRHHGGTTGRLLVSLAAAVVVLLSLPSAGRAALITGTSGAEYTSPDAAVRDEWFGKTREARAGIVRINLSWRGVTRGQPVDPSAPADPAYDFSALDAGVKDAAETGIEVLLTVTGAPDFAEGPNRPPNAPPGTWKPDPEEYGAFARAVAERYSGGFGGLPRVRYFQAWNEPNLSSYLNPVWNGKSAASPSHYRRMLNAFESSVHSVRADNIVVTAGTAPYGEDPGGKRMRPLKFWREVFCLGKKAGGALFGKKCPTKASFDILAHHPINTSGGPRRSAIHPDDASTPDFKHVRATLRAAEKRNKVTGGRHDLWATEIWWESNPPDRSRGVGLRKHAKWYQESLYLLWKQGADAVINLLIRDGAYDPSQPSATIEAGLYFNDGSPKPALTAFRFPFVTERASKKRLRAWGKSPAAGTLVIERKRKQGWRETEQLTVESGEVFTERLRIAGPAKLRASVGTEQSLAWKQQR